MKIYRVNEYEVEEVNRKEALRVAKTLLNDNFTYVGETDTEPDPEPEPTPEPEPEPQPEPTQKTFLYPWDSDSLWLRPIPANPAIYSDSASRIDKFISVGKMNETGVICHTYGVGTVSARTDGKGFTVTSNPSRGENYNLSQLNSAGPVPIPDNAIPSGGTDLHLSVIDLAKNRVWDMGGCGFVNGAWRASYGHTYSLDTDGIAASTVIGATAANFPLLGGLIRPEEIQAGVINHAITFCSPCRENKHYPPATHHGNGTATAGSISEGSLTQLDPTLNVDSLAISGWQKIILKAWQKYGAYHRDGGGRTNVYCEDDVNRTSGQLKWSDVGLGAEYNRFTNSAIPWNRLRVLVP